MNVLIDLIKKIQLVFSFDTFKAKVDMLLS